MSPAELKKAQRDLLLFVQKRRGLPARRGNLEQQHRDYLVYRSVVEAGWVVPDDDGRAVPRFQKLTDAGRAWLATPDHWQNENAKKSEVVETVDEVPDAFGDLLK